MAMSRKVRRRTTTSAITEVLEMADDFLSQRDLIGLTGEGASRVSAALHWLNECGAVAIVVQDGECFYCRSAFTDRREFVRDETAEHTKPRRRARIMRVEKDA